MGTDDRENTRGRLRLPSTTHSEAEEATYSGLLPHPNLKREQRQIKDKATKAVHLSIQSSQHWQVSHEVLLFKAALKSYPKTSL